VIETKKPEVYSIAAHRGFADALVSGILPRYSKKHVGLAELTLILPSARAAMSVRESFIRYAGMNGFDGLLMPRMVMVGDHDLDQSLGSLFDPMGDSSTLPATNPLRRCFEIGNILSEVLKKEGQKVDDEATLLRLAKQFGDTLDRLLAEGISFQDFFSDRVIGTNQALAKHWQDGTRIFAMTYANWQAKLKQRGEVDLAVRRNQLFEQTSRRWHANPPKSPVIAAGVTGAAPSLAKLLRTISVLPEGSVILPDLDLTMPNEAWLELGLAGQPKERGGPTFSQNEASTHPQYHLKLLLNRMGVAREEVRDWPQKCADAADPQRSHAISSLFLPPKASQIWANLPSEKRAMPRLKILECSTIEEEAQTIAVIIREALEQPEKRVSLVTPDRGLARRVSQHLERWDINADDSAGLPLSLTPAGRFFLQIAELINENFAPVQLIAVLSHPLVKNEGRRGEWLKALRILERKLRGPRPAPGIQSISKYAEKGGISDWWKEVEELISPISALAARTQRVGFADALDVLAEVSENLAGSDIWAKEDGRALSSLIDEIRYHSREAGAVISVLSLHQILRDIMNEVAVRPPYRGHPRVSIYGLLEARMTNADVVICGALNESTWPRSLKAHGLLAPAILRALGMPGPEFTTGLAAHDLASALSAPKVVLTRSLRDMDGPTIPSRFLTRVEALIGEKVEEHRLTDVKEWAASLDRSAEKSETYPRPQPCPSSDLRKVPIKVTGLDRLLGDPFQFYAQEILRLKKIDRLDADPERDFAWKGKMIHDILEQWHKENLEGNDANLLTVGKEFLRNANLHPLVSRLWSPRIFKALSWISETVQNDKDRSVVAVEHDGKINFSGVTVYGRADRIDISQDGSLTIVDYKTGKPPSAAQVAKGYALQLGILGLIAEGGGFDGLSGQAVGFEYWSLSKNKDGQFGFRDQPIKWGKRRTGLPMEEFLPKHRAYLSKAIDYYIKGKEPFTARLNPDYPGYNDYDQLMRLEEWQVKFATDIPKDIS